MDAETRLHDQCRLLLMEVAVKNGQMAEVMRNYPRNVQQTWRRLTVSVSNGFLDVSDFLVVCSRSFKSATLTDIFSSLRKKHNSRLEKQGKSRKWIREVELLFQLLDVNNNGLLSPDELLFLTAAMSKPKSWGQLFRTSRSLVERIIGELRTTAQATEVNLRCLKQYLFEESEARVMAYRKFCVRTMQAWYYRHGKEGTCLWTQASNYALSLCKPPSSIEESLRKFIMRHELLAAQLCAEPQSKKAVRSAVLVLYKDFAKELRAEGKDVSAAASRQRAAAADAGDDEEEESRSTTSSAGGPDPVLKTLFWVFKTHTTLGLSLLNTITEKDQKTTTKTTAASGAGADAAAVDRTSPRHRKSPSSGKAAGSKGGGDKILDYLTLQDWHQIVSEAQWAPFRSEQKTKRTPVFGVLKL
mmetsp:Transcript_37553/g.69222  ORF Transcript_37553/g.69222 Transcript_37553/m.69222 type:complete len:414 (-) Transcript_37553:249-1490(-)